MFPFAFVTILPEVVLPCAYNSFHMTDQELLDMFIQERIDMLLNHRSKPKPRNSPETNERIVQAELIVSNLSGEGRKLVQDYIDHFTDIFADNNSYLYQQGFLDGVWAMNFLGKL